MKLRLHAFSLSLVALLSITARAAAPIPAESQIASVTVYTDRAVITRTATVDLAATGAVELTFDRLPESLMAESLQVSGSGAAQATLLDVTARPTFVDFTPNERVKSLEDQLRQLAHEERTLSDRATVLGQQRDYVIKIQNFTTTPVKDAATAVAEPEAWLKLLSFSDQQLTKLAAEVQQVDRQREDLRAKRTALEQQLDELRGSGGRSFNTVTVRLDVTKPGKLDVALKYAVHGASWTPSYDVRVRSGERTAQLGYFGLVRQSTGEDWKNVELTLSTARPSLGGAAPELEPWIVQQQEFRPMATAAAAEPPAQFDAAIAQRELLIAGQERARAQRKAMDFYIAPAAIESQATSAIFKLPVAASVPSDNSPQKLPIAAASLATAPEYRTTPKLVPSAFLTAKVTNTSEYPLLGGSMNVFLDDTFVASSSIRTVMPTEKFDLALGVDEGISVKRKLNNRFTEDTGVVNKSKRITYDITITVQNNKRTAETIVVHDQLPVSRHEKIIVKQITPDERQLKPDSEGVLKWTFELKPGEKRDLPLKFSVEHPNDLPVIGLE